ncbi:MAG: hypothetical protein KA122_07920, partial [Verrucomicrobia bacterium]|nr:hypothetical protein [Verrucomicrobiota bacterium]
IRGALARFGRGYAPPCARQRGNPETMNQNSHSNWINKWGLASCGRYFLLAKTIWAIHIPLLVCVGHEH